MNNNIEVIGIDHGWSQMKTSNTCFNTSIKELANAPAFHDNVLEYDDRYFAVGEERLEVLDSKVENENTGITSGIYALGGVEYVNIVMQNDEVSN